MGVFSGSDFLFLWVRVVLRRSVAVLPESFTFPCNVRRAVAPWRGTVAKGESLCCVFFRRAIFASLLPFFGFRLIFLCAQRLPPNQSCAL